MDGDCSRPVIVALYRDLRPAVSLQANDDDEQK